MVLFCTSKQKLTTAMYLKPEALDEMIKDSGVKTPTIEERTGLSRTTIFRIKAPGKPYPTVDQVIQIAKAINMNPVKYFPELEKTALNILEEPPAEYQKKQTEMKLVEYFEDILLKIDGFQSEYVRNLQHTILLQQEINDGLKKQLSGKK